MKTIKLHLLALALLVSGALVTFTGCGKNYDDELAQLSAQNVQLAEYIQQTLRGIEGDLELQDYVLGEMWDDLYLQDGVWDNIDDLRSDVDYLLDKLDDPDYGIDAIWAYINGELADDLSSLSRRIGRLYGWRYNYVNPTLQQYGLRLDALEALALELEGTRDSLKKAFDVNADQSDSLVMLFDSITNVYNTLNGDIENLNSLLQDYATLEDVADLKNELTESLLWVNRRVTNEASRLEGLINQNAARLNKLNERIDSTNKVFNDTMAYVNNWFTNAEASIKTNSDNLSFLWNTWLPANNAELNQKIADNLTYIQALFARAAVTGDSLKGAFDSINKLYGRMGVAEGEINTLKGLYNEAKDKFDQLEPLALELYYTVMGKGVPGDPDYVYGLVDQVGALTTDLGLLDGRVEDVENRLNNPSTGLDAINAKLVTYNQRIGTIETALWGTNGWVAQVTNSLAALSGRITALETWKTTAEGQLAFLLQQQWNISLFDAPSEIKIAFDGTVSAQKFEILVNTPETAQLIADPANLGNITLTSEGKTKAPSTALFTAASAVADGRKVTITTRETVLDPTMDYYVVALEVKVVSTLDPTLSASKEVGGIKLAVDTETLTSISVRRPANNETLYLTANTIPATEADLLSAFGYDYTTPLSYAYVGHAGSKTLKPGGILDHIGFGFNIVEMNQSTTFPTGFSIDVNAITAVAMYCTYGNTPGTPWGLYSNAKTGRFMTTYWNAAPVGSGVYFTYGPTGTPAGYGLVTASMGAMDMTGSLIVFELPLLKGGVPYEENGVALKFYAPIYCHL